MDGEFDEIALKFAQAIVQRSGYLTKEDIFSCYDMAVDFCSYSEFKEKKDDHDWAVKESMKRLICLNCEKPIKSRWDITDCGWETGFRCKNVECKIPMFKEKHEKCE